MRNFTRSGNLTKIIPIECLLIFSLMSAVGCGVRAHVKSIKVDGFELEEPYYKEEIGKIVNRASFELDCSKEKLSSRVLSVERGYMKHIGITGCNHRAVYVFTLYSGYVLNSIDGAVKNSTKKP